jgi:hypothetical protein
LTVVAGAVGMVVALVAALVIAKLAGSGTGPSAPAKPASKQVLDHIASVPVRTLNSIGAGSASATPASITAPSLTKDGKPEILYVGAEYCLYCAAERWAVAVALSRFAATLRSALVSFVPRELESNKVVDGRYQRHRRPLPRRRCRLRPRSAAWQDTRTGRRCPR